MRNPKQMDGGSDNIMLHPTYVGPMLFLALNHQKKYFEHAEGWGFLYSSGVGAIGVDKKTKMATRNMGGDQAQNPV